MVTSPVVKFLVDADGSITVEVDGVRGPACEELTRELLKRLGPVAREERKAEYYARPVESEVRSRAF